MRQSFETLESRQLMASGTLDGSFGTAGGTTTTRVPIDAINETLGTNPQTVARQIAVDAGGRTIVLARTTSSATLYRLTEAGALDTRFAAATGGFLQIKLPTSFGGNGDQVSIALDQNNRTYVQLGPQVLRITVSGKIDKTYGLRGNAMLYQTAQFAGGNDIAVEPDGSAYVVGSVNVEGFRRMAVAKLLPGGQLDVRFGLRGVLVPPSGQTIGSDIRILNDGAVMATGLYEEADPAAAATALKFSARTGRLDTTYGQRGKTFFSISQRADEFSRVNSVAIRGDGAVLYHTFVSSLTDSNQPAVEKNWLFAANGRSVVEIDVTPGSGTVTEGEFVLDTNVFPGDASAGSELFVDRVARSLTRYTKSSATYTLDSTFNGGQPILGPQAVATTGGGAILFAGTGRSASDNQLTVGRVFATEAPSAQAFIAPLTAPARGAVVVVALRDDDAVVFDRTDGTPTGAVLRGRAGIISGRILSTNGVDDTITFVFNGPGGSWDRRDNGSYFVDVNFDNLVHDRDGGIDGFLGTKRLGKLIVAIA